ncbi:hypothetical protein C8J55DRAFT_558463 [Lentinula edodes]|uniref:Uncharacterized protein n=1 Tax=Lentinula lateritia TaxID=40482 RepID=A0A9W9ARS5_9AGAR|nr:hypothetical protein C8J55DRAFT_558463 [Lentinula edodes]
MNMTPNDYSQLKQTLQGHFFYLGRQGPFPEGCGWFTLDGKKTYCAPLTAGQETPNTVPLQIVGRVGTNLNNTGIFGGWTPSGQFPPGGSRRTFQLGPPLSGIFRDDWIAAITKLKEVQTAGANNTRKVRYLFVHENVPPLDSLIRMGCKVFCDLDEGEGPDELLSSSIPPDKKANSEWVEIRQSKALAPFPLFAISGEPIPLKRVRSVIAGATVRVTFGLRCWRFNPNDPFSFAADIVRIDLLSSPQDECGPRIGFPLTPPVTPQSRISGTNPSGTGTISGNTPSYRSQPLFVFQNSEGGQSDTSLLTSIASSGSPQTPTGSGSRYVRNYGSPTPENNVIASPYEGVMQSFNGTSLNPRGDLGAAFEITNVGFTGGGMVPQGSNEQYRRAWNGGGAGTNIGTEYNGSDVVYQEQRHYDYRKAFGQDSLGMSTNSHTITSDGTAPVLKFDGHGTGENTQGSLSTTIDTNGGHGSENINAGNESAHGAIAVSGTPTSSAASDKVERKGSKRMRDEDEEGGYRTDGTTKKGKRRAE